MKKLQMIAAIMAFTGAALFADRVVPVTQLPKAAQDLISQHFAGKTATYVEADFNEYDVALNDGSEITFSGDGSWIKIESYTGVPAALLPQAVINNVNQTYAGMVIIKAEKEWNGFEIELSNRMQLFFDQNGNLIGQKYDD